MPRARSLNDAQPVRVIRSHRGGGGIGLGRHHRPGSQRELAVGNHGFAADQAGGYDRSITRRCSGLDRLHARVTVGHQPDERRLGFR